jgi:hypothetical protein
VTHPVVARIAPVFAFLSARKRARRATRLTWETHAQLVDSLALIKLVTNAASAAARAAPGSVPPRLEISAGGLLAFRAELAWSASTRSWMGAITPVEEPTAVESAFQF